MKILLALACVVSWPVVSWAGAWTQPPRTAWVKVAAIYQLADAFYSDTSGTLPNGSRFDEGDERPYEDGGASRLRLLWSEAELGITSRFTVGAQVPYYSLRYEDRFSVTDTWGIGDVRLIGRYGLLTAQHRLTARVAWKLATGKSTDDPELISIGDGQQDLDLGLQWGMSLGRPLAWVGAELGYRIRGRDPDRGWNPGNEVIWAAEIGYPLLESGRAGLKLFVQGARGDESSLASFPNGVDLSRDFDQLEGSLLLDLGWSFVEIGWGKTLGSKTYPTAGVWNLGISRRFSLEP